MVMTYFLYQWVPQPVTQVPLIDTLPERWVGKHGELKPPERSLRAIRAQF
jgi:hypothetical protein